MSGISVTITGADKIAQNLAAIAKMVPEAAAAALYQEGEQLRTESQNAVPVDLGTLKNSAFVNDPQTDKDGVFVTVGYGGAAKAYALAVHEYPSSYSPPSWQNGVQFTTGGPKYLERPLLARAKDMPARILDRIRAALKVT
jgi:hypothetical protein